MACNSALWLLSQGVCVKQISHPPGQWSIEWLTEWMKSPSQLFLCVLSSSLLLCLGRDCVCSWQMHWKSCGWDKKWSGYFKTNEAPILICYHYYYFYCCTYYYSIHPPHHPCANCQVSWKNRSLLILLNTGRETGGYVCLCEPNIPYLKHEPHGQQCWSFFVKPCSSSNLVHSDLYFAVAETCSFSKITLERLFCSLCHVWIISLQTFEFITKIKNFNTMFRILKAQLALIIKTLKMFF